MAAPVSSSAAVCLQICSWTFCFLCCSHPVSTVVPHFLSIFTAHKSHHPCHFLPMTQCKSIFPGDQSQIGKKPIFHLVFSTISFYSTTESALYFFLGLTQEWQLGWGLLRGKSSHYYTESLLYPQASKPHFWIKIIQVPFISHRMSSSLGCCSFPQTDFLFQLDTVNVSHYKIRRKHYLFSLPF